MYRLQKRHEMATNKHKRTTKRHNPAAKKHTIKFVIVSLVLQCFALEVK